MFIWQNTLSVTVHQILVPDLSYFLIEQLRDHCKFQGPLICEMSGKENMMAEIG